MRARVQRLDAVHAVVEQAIKHAILTLAYLLLGSRASERVKRDVRDMDADEVCVSTSEVTLVVGYPFADQYAVPTPSSTPACFTRAELFRQLVRVHSAMYEGATFSAMVHLDNTHVKSPRFGDASHVLEDLVVEEVLLETRGARVFAWIYIGS